MFKAQGQLVLVIVIASVYPSEQDPKIWNSTQENDTEDLSMGAIGLAPNRGNANTGFDKTGKLKPKWA
ncbi:hypothetical protein DAPPUDRAFT_263404 [Daphnia pulex]|uniref:Uncharacterized protein n=1 Tax=Daphnia pulex TaxID=6669 RepID=E9HPP3_DAPPU|nr:hypothetical protein DAPPUDRAFT_263404 [Daphnia pulex]|eukprot:EFX66304.1 hypothetical protein DAPPUDRAFT_263404 [Daphnia pulex]